MIYSMVTDDAFTELSILREKASVALGCIRDDAKCPRDQTLTYIAGDYLSAMGEMIQIMQENRIKPLAPS